jgi:hypothetical protein
MGWSTAQRDWQATQTLLALAAWKSSPFDRLWRRQIPKAAGLYIVTGSPPVKGRFSEAWCPLYAGHTLNLNVRFDQHLKGDTGVKKIRHVFRSLRFHYLEIGTTDKGRLRALEQLLLDAFGPIANDRRATIAMRIRAPVSLDSLQPESEKTV